MVDEEVIGLRGAPRVAEVGVDRRGFVEGGVDDAPGALDELERTLRLADDVVRHKLIRLPDAEAERRGMAVGAA